MPAASKSRKAVATKIPAREVAMQQFTELVNLIPEGEGDDGAGMIIDILSRDTWESLNTPSKLPSAEDMAGRRLVINDMTRHVSTIADGLPFFLVVEAVDDATGEVVRFQTSAVTVTTKLAKLYALDVLPAKIVISRADKATKAGYFPLDLTVIAATS